MWSSLIWAMLAKANRAMLEQRQTASTGQYTYVWKTNRTWAGTCRRLMMMFTDGTEATASFDFR
jgi:hypothetical protein